MEWLVYSCRLHFGVAILLALGAGITAIALIFMLLSNTLNKKDGKEKE